MVGVGNGQREIMGRCKRSEAFPERSWLGFLASPRGAR